MVITAESEATITGGVSWYGDSDGLMVVFSGVPAPVVLFLVVLLLVLIYVVGVLVGIGVGQRRQQRVETARITGASTPSTPSAGP